MEHWDARKQRSVRDFYTSFFFSAREKAVEVLTDLWKAARGWVAAGQRGARTSRQLPR